MLDFNPKTLKQFLLSYAVAILIVAAALGVGTLVRLIWLTSR